VRSLTRAHTETRKKNEAYDDRRKVPPVTAVISVARCRAFNHRTRAFPYVKHGQPRRQVPQTGRALSGARHSSTVHRPAVHTCMCRWLPRRRHRRTRRKPSPSRLAWCHGTHTAIRPCSPRSLAVREIFSLISARLTRGFRLGVVT